MHTKKQIIDALLSFGLDEKETIIYLFLLKHIEASGYTISKEIKLPRSTIYGKLESLEKKNIIQSFRKNNIVHYTPESISTLFSLLDIKQEQIAAIMPDLRNMISDKRFSKPQTRLFIGKDGIRTVWDEIA